MGGREKGGEKGERRGREGGGKKTHGFVAAVAVEDVHGRAADADADAEVMVIGG